MSQKLLKSRRLIDFVREDALLFGDFELSSGAKSNYFIDMSKVTNDSSGLDAILRSLIYYLEEGVEWKCHSIGGPVLGAAPLIGGMLQAYYHKYAGVSRMRGFMIRKEEKNGTFIEGNFRSGDNVLIVEDVVTTGTQTKRAVEIVEANGGNVLGIVAVLDRQGGARELLGDRFDSILTIQDLGIGN